MTDKSYNTTRSNVEKALSFILPLKIAFKVILPKRFLLFQKAHAHKLFQFKTQYAPLLP